MKVNSVFCAIYSVLLLVGTSIYADSVSNPSSKGLYFGVFAGGGSLSSNEITQQGTAFFSEIEGGPLAVNAKGNANGNSVWLAGGQVGYAGSNKMLTKKPSAWNVTPAAELEGYYLGNSSLTGNLVNDTTRLDAHNFSVTYPMSTGVFLVNAVLSFNDADGSKIHPYVGLGLGAGVVSIHNAKSIQTEPSEPGVNHYNSGTNDTNTTFAFQPKLGVRYDLNQRVSFFAEYRFLYLASNSFTFGSTVYNSHVPTSPWNVKMDALNYNLGLVGVRYTF